MIWRQLYGVWLVTKRGAMSWYKGYAQADKYSWRRMAEQTHALYMNALNDK